MFSIFFHPAIRKDLKKVHPATRIYFTDEIVPKLAADPSASVRLTGLFRDLQKYEFHHQGVSYRVIYKTDFNKKEITIIIVGSRGEVYKRLSQRMR